MRKSAFESKSLDEKKEKDKKKANVLFEADDPKPERPVEIFEKEDSTPHSFQELLGVADKKDNEPETYDVETEDDGSVEAVESESRDGELDKEEEPHVAKEITKAEKTGLSHEEAAVERDSPEAAGIVAARSLVEKFDEKIEEMPLDQALEAAAAEVEAEINQDLEQNVEAPEDDSELPAGKPVELETESMEEPELDEDEELEVGGPPPPPPPTDTSPGGGEPAPEPEPDPVTASGGSNTTPPRGPVPPWLNPNIVGPGQNNPNLTAGTEISAAERAHQRAGDVLIGGILGYLLGRRRGRIKTERRLEPVKEKLEQEVIALREKIQDKEREVRELARSAAEEKKSVKQRQELIERLQPKKIDKAVKAEADNTSLEEAMPLQAAESNHAETLHKRPETIGRMAVTVDTPTPETLKETPREALQARRVEHMAATELLAVAERIVVEGASVREMYEAGRLDPEGLRHVVAEYLRGGNVEKMVAREALGEERQHERQPERQPGPFVSTAKSSGVAQSSGAATSPAAKPNDVRQRLAEFSNPDNSHAFNVITNNKPKQQNAPKVLITIVSLAAVVMVIAAYVISAG